MKRKKERMEEEAKSEAGTESQEGNRMGWNRFWMCGGMWGRVEWNGLGNTPLACSASAVTPS